VAGLFEIAVSEHILSEVSRALTKPYFRSRLTEEEVAEAELLLRDRARMVQPDIEIHGVASHPEDDLILATAMSAEASYLVTGDAALLAIGEYQGIQIRSPRDFLEVLLSG
jgi:putative PIN family toxin of toxin-antitoxin system